MAKKKNSATRKKSAKRSQDSASLGSPPVKRKRKNSTASLKQSEANKKPAKKSTAQPKSAEQETSDKPFPIVGIGASAGGLSALKTLFKHVPEDSGLAYVVVVHLAPDHKSHLAELLQPHVHMPVQQVTETTALQPNRVYVIPPNANLNTIDTHLRLSELEERRRERAPIDHFFRTLASTHDGHAIGVILTGTGSDGTLGIKEIKATGGLTIVQDPNEAEYDGMPQSSIATGVVDLILTLAEIPEAVMNFTATQPQLAVPSDDSKVERDQLQFLHKVFAQIRSRSGRDFSRYKRSTIFRRITRRMQLAQIEESHEYLAMLRENPAEIKALADDLLITVTNFFRDSDVFEYLEQKVVAQLFEGKESTDNVRIWSLGCSTGEEAYSLAMLLLEESARRGVSPGIQVFASDLHEHSLAKAREGFYPGDVEIDVSESRLKRFFKKENGGYRIRKEVREIVVFAPHNLLSDPPFSRLDLISCRNLLIYLQREVHRDVADLFHYALKPHGYLLLGSAETIEASELFVLTDKKSCMYQKRDVPGPEPRLPVFPVARTWLPEQNDEDHEHPRTPLAFGTMHQRMVEQYAPPSVLVSPEAKVVHLSQNAGRYLTHPGGDPTTSVFRLIREELRFDLRSALHAAQEGNPASTVPIRFNVDGHEKAVAMYVRPATEPQHEGFMLIIFDERELTPHTRLDRESTISESHALVDQRIDEQEAELGQARQRIQAMVEEYETSQEEMKAANEELQSSNEELRSTLEELETSKEELQSMNEELQTVNQENRHKVEELGQLSSDLQNLLAATDIATLFLDRDLRILRFTPKVDELFNVRMTDRGRPISDFTQRLGYGQLRDDAQRVIARLVPTERELRDEAGNWYLTRVLPYRSAEDRIEGVVITFVDISHRKAAEEALRQSEEFLRLSVEAAKVGTWDLNLETGDCEVSAQTAALFGFAPERQTLSRQRWLEAIAPDDRSPVQLALEAVGNGHHAFQIEFRVGRSVVDMRWLFAKGDLTRTDSAGTPHLCGASIDITELKKAEAAFRESEERLRQAAAAAKFGSYSFEIGEDRSYWSPELYAIVGIDPELPITMERVLETIYEEDRERYQQFSQQAIRAGDGKEYYGEFRYQSPDGNIGWLSDQGRIISSGEGKQRRAVRAVGMVIDITERKTAQLDLQQLNESLEEQVSRRTAMMQILQDVTREANQAASVEAAFHAALQRISQYNGWQVGHVWRLADDGSRDMVSSGIWYVAEDKPKAIDKLEAFQRVAEQTRFSPDQSLIGKVTATAKPQWIDDIPAVPDWLRGDPQELGLQAVIAFPVTLGGSVVAVIEFFSNHPTKREDRFMEIMPDIGIQLGHVIERHRLEKAIDTATTEQQRSIGQDLHDGVAQELTGCSMLAETLRQELDSEQSKHSEQAAKLVTYLREANRQVRNLSRGLIPVEIDSEGLMQALDLLVEHVQELFNVSCTFRCEQPVPIANNQVATHLYRIAQEATQNAAKHGEPEQVEVRLESDGEQVKLTVTDNGKGMPEEASLGAGLRIMRHRASLIGGRFRLKSTAGEGVTITCRVPIEW